MKKLIGARQTVGVVFGCQSFDSVGMDREIDSGGSLEFRFQLQKLCPWKECLVMNLRRMFYLAVLVALGAGLGTNAFAQPIFENNTPAGFSPSDSTKSPNFVIDKEVTV